MLATLLVMASMVQLITGHAEQRRVAGLSSNELAQWDESLRRAGATSTEVNEFEALLRRQSAAELEEWAGYIRAVPKFSEDYLKIVRLRARERTRQFTPPPVYPDVLPIRSCESLKELSLPNTTIEAAAVGPSDKACHVTASLTHPPAVDRVKIFVALPIIGWNGRFQGTGGGGFSGGDPENLNVPVEKGYAAGATDAGHEGQGASFALDGKGRLNWQDIRDNAYLGIHDMTVLGKEVTAAFYGKPPKYSYFVGASTGGRQGLMEAQRYPEDFDGILSASPAINWDRIIPAALWPQDVMLQAKNFVSKAKLDAATAGAVAACDGADGVVDGVIDDPMQCAYDPKALVGTQVGAVSFTEADAQVIRKIWEGPRSHEGEFLWHGIARGADLSAVAATEGAPLKGKPFSISLEWVQYFLVHNPQWDWTSLAPGEYELLFKQSVEQYRSLIGTDDPDLTRFRDRGGKLIVYHGLADQVIPAQGSVDYYRQVEAKMGGSERTAEFARLFLVPGVDHGLHGAGPSPTGMINAIVAWVEEGKAPDRLLAESSDKYGKAIRTRPLYPYPQVAKYKGKGSTNLPDSFESSGQR